MMRRMRFSNKVYRWTEPRLYEKKLNDYATTDGDAGLAKKSPGAESRLAYHGHVLMENRVRCAPFRFADCTAFASSIMGGEW